MCQRSSDGCVFDFIIRSVIAGAVKMKAEREYFE